MIFFANGNYYLADEEPHYNEHWGRYYVWAKRWIKSTKKFSGNTLLHNSLYFEKLTDEEAKLQGLK